MPPALPDGTAPSASVGHLKAQAARTHPGAKPEHLGSPPWPQERASGRPTHGERSSGVPRGGLHPAGSDLHQLSLVAVGDGAIFRITKKDFLEFIENNPGAFIWMRDTLVVE